MSQFWPSSKRLHQRMMSEKCFVRGTNVALKFYAKQVRGVGNNERCDGNSTVFREEIKVETTGGHDVHSN